MIHLRFTAGARAGQTVRIEKALATVGRAASCDLVIDDPMVSAVHATLERAPAGYIVTDQHSSNGTLVNGQRIFRALVRVDDELGFGSTALKVEDSEGLAATVHMERPPWALDAQPLVVEALGRTIAIPPGGLVVGRHSDCGLVVDDPQVSARHCRIVVAADGVVRVVDAGGRNGTFVVGQKGETRVVAPTPLAAGAVVRVGGVRLRLARASVAGELTLDERGWLPRAMRGATLRLVAGEQPGRAVPLEAVVTRIGRGSDNHVVLGDRSVSAHHCTVAAEERGFVLRDAGSSNGTFVNGARLVGERVLVGGDLIGVGLESVLELQLDGAARVTLDGLASVLAAGAQPGEAQPRFVVRGAVLRQARCTVGRDAASDLFLDDPSVPRAAIEIEFADGGFRARALAAGALAVNGGVVGEAALASGDVLTIARWPLRVEIAGARCALHEKSGPPSLNASWAREAELAAQAPVVAEAALPRAVFSTLFAADADKLAALAPRREKKKAAPKWKATSDLVADRTRGGAALGGLGAAAVALALVVGGGPRAFLDGELARAHDSQAFVRRAGERGLGSGCSTCHAGRSAISDRCRACHDGFTPRRGRAAAAGHDHLAAGLRCPSCHEEHQGAARGEVLVARHSCANAGCHDRRRPPHQRLQPEPETAFVASVRMRAPSEIRFFSGSAAAAQERLHAVHAGVTRRCMACHTAADGVSPGVATSACARCHADALRVLAAAPTSGEATSCLGCHAAHEQTLARAVDVGPRWSGLRPARSGATAALALGALFLVAGGLASRYFGRRVARVVELTREPTDDSRRPEAAPPRLVERPDLDPHYQTNVPGLYLIGEPTGKSLIKNAANLGRVVVEHMAQSGLRPGDGAAAGVDVEVLCVGSGAGGLSAALTARRLGLGCAVLDKERASLEGEIGEPKGVANISPLPLDDRQALDDLLQREKIDLRLGEEVIEVRRAGDRFQVTTSQGVVSALGVVLSPDNLPTVWLQQMGVRYVQKPEGWSPGPTDSIPR
jgi:pSer/pThr/pTyr-binding forkhead associated (FHA) protein